jgi:2-(1,2-epoxy-1,2-dihydrophenyl)acetyl-CoA isomerase
MKQALNRGASTDFSAALHYESLVQGVPSDTDDHREGVAAFREGRDPDFNGK